MVILDEPSMAPMVAPVKVPAVQVIPVSPLGLATIIPAGRLSPVTAGENCTPVRFVAVLGLLMVNVNAVLVPVKMGFAVNALAITGGSITVSDD